jgi:hypothetical protein
MKKKHPLNEAADAAIDHTEDLLFHGSVFGGRSLQELLDKYKAEGPFTPTRNELMKHLVRCLTHIHEMDAFIIARARTMPHSRLAQHIARRETNRPKFKKAG